MYASSQFPLTGFAYDVSPDGQRFLMLKDNPGKPMAEPSGVVVVLNWFEELRPRVAAK